METCNSFLCSHQSVFFNEIESELTNFMKPLILNEKSAVFGISVRSWKACWNAAKMFFLIYFILFLTETVLKKTTYNVTSCPLKNENIGLSQLSHISYYIITHLQIYFITAIQRKIQSVKTSRKKFFSKTLGSNYS